MEWPVCTFADVRSWKADNFDWSGRQGWDWVE
jgi:hypothetical protein